ncbi:MAG TPA: guanylate kinase [Acidobacteriaceae bacterium]|nr:guanylate kinase [Acidobacteriaceae bacterium]
MAGILFLISAPSGSGKSTLVNRVRSLVDGLDFSVSYTTRLPRGSEKDGQEYHYITRGEFEQMIERGGFLEHATVFGNYYGTAIRSLEEARAQGKDLLLDIDVQGAAQVREKMPDAVSIFVLPPNPTALETRLLHRSRAEGGDFAGEVKKRLAKAKDEIENYRRYSYILVNDDLDRAVDDLSAIILAERAKRQGAPGNAETARVLEIAEQCRQSKATDRLRPVLSSFGLLDAAHA